jgi:Short C-terminal domain
MALLSQVIRSRAITGRTDTVFTRIAGRQGGRWAEETVRAALPAPADPARPQANPAETLGQLEELHRRGVLTDEEYETLRARLSI